FATARVFVAPLRYGAGVKGKLYTAMAFGAPIVTTTIGAEGIGLAEEDQVLVADAPNAFAAAVVRVFQGRQLELRLRAIGPAFVARNATLAAGAEVMREAIARLREPAETARVVAPGSLAGRRSPRPRPIPPGEEALEPT